MYLETLFMIFAAFVVGVAFGRITEMDKKMMNFGRENEIKQYTTTA